jgi:hypothetical protein
LSKDLRTGGFVNIITSSFVFVSWEFFEEGSELGNNGHVDVPMALQKEFCIFLGVFGSARGGPIIINQVFSNFYPFWEFLIALFRKVPDHTVPFQNWVFYYLRISKWIVRNHLTIFPTDCSKLPPCPTAADFSTVDHVL